MRQHPVELSSAIPHSRNGDKHFGVTEETGRGVGCDIDFRSCWSALPAVVRARIEQASEYAMMDIEQKISISHEQASFALAA